MVAFMKEQRKAGHDVRAIIAPGKGDLGEKLQQEGFEYHVLDYTLFSGPLLSTAIKVLRGARLLRKLRPDVIHSHIFEAYLMSRSAGWIADVPIRLAMIPGPYPLESPLLRLVDCGTAWQDTKTIASCEYTRRLYLEAGVPAEQLELIYYALDQSGLDPALADRGKLREELGISDETPVIGKVAYFYPPQSIPCVAPPNLLNRGVKGHDVLIRSVPHVLKEFPDARFVLVGSAFGNVRESIDHEQWLRALPAELGVEEHVIFAGERRDIPDVLASFDVSTHCSLSDNLAGTVESLLMERPMVVSDIGGFRDTVIHEKTGLVVPRDDPKALAEAIIRLLKDRELASRLGKEGRRWMLERFTLARSVSDIEDLYQRCEAPYAARGMKPHEAGYRLGRGVLRTIAMPFRYAGFLREARKLLGANRPSLLRRAYWKVKGMIATRVRRIFGIERPPLD
jgi:glycosyltransferase involved in cell wall biosynthesis